MKRIHGNYRRKHGKRSGKKSKQLRELIAVRDRLNRLIERMERV